MSRASRLLAAAVALGAALTLGGCAGLRQDEQQAAQNGPEFLVKGRLSLRRVGEPTLLASFEWVRGYLADGWTEQIELKNQHGLPLFKALEVRGKSTVRIAKRVRTVGSLDDVMSSQLGVDVGTATLAGWVANDTPAGPLPDRLNWQGIAVEVLTRGRHDRPARLKLQQGGNIMLLAITEYVD